MASATPQRFPFDDDDRPSGSVRPLSQADLQAILAHLGDDSEELLAGTGADRPVVAMRVRATVGRPGGSAQARWRRMRAADWTAWTRTLPWRVAAILGICAGGAVLGNLVAPRLGLVVGGLAAMAAGWGLRFRPGPDAVAWRRGAVGERRTARLLGPLEWQGWAVLHDLTVPGSRANIDHLVIGPGGVFVIDSKQYRGRLQVDPSGRLWHGRYPLAPTLRAVSFEADQAAQVLTDPEAVVVPIVAVHGAQVPWGQGGHGRGTGCPSPALAKHASHSAGGAGPRAGRRPGRAGSGPLPRCRLTRSACPAPATAGARGVPAWLPTLLLAAGVLGLEVLAANAARDRPGGVLLGPDPERPGWLAAAGDLEPLPRLAGRRLHLAVPTRLAFTVALAAEEAEMLLGRLRGATSQQLGEAARQLGARLQRHQAALATSLTAAIDRGAGLLAEAEDRRNQRSAELDRAADLLAGVTAWIQPPPVPSPASQGAIVDRVQ